MFMLLGLFPCALACGPDCMKHLTDAKAQIFKQKFAEGDAMPAGGVTGWYDNDNGGTIDWDEFWEDVGPSGDNKKVHQNLILFVKAAAGADGVQNDGGPDSEFNKIGDALLQSEGDKSKLDADRTVRYTTDANDAIDDVWMTATAKDKASRSFDELSAGAKTISVEKMAEEIARMLFGMVGEFDRKGPEGLIPSDRNKYTTKALAGSKWTLEVFWELSKPFLSLGIDRDEFDAAFNMDGGAGKSFVETVEAVHAEVDASADQGSLVQDLEQQLRNLDAERDAILQKLHEQKQKQVPVRKGADTGDRKRGFREVEIRPETASKIIGANTGDEAGVVKNL